MASADDNMDFLGNLIHEMSVNTATISSGHNRDTLFDDDDESRKFDRLNEDLKDLKCLTRGVNIGAESCSMENMSCIGYDANSPYAKMNPNAQPKDNWWSHFYLNYAQDDSTVAHSTVAIMGCYLDLNQRTSDRLKNTYAKDCVNVYIPTDTYGCIHKQMTEVSEFNAFAQGGEIIDRAQGLTSFLCQNADKSSGLTVVMYQKVLGPDPDAAEANEEDQKEKIPASDSEDDHDDDVEQEDVLIGYNRKEFPMATMYEAAKDTTKFRMLGGVAFVRFGLSYTCDPGSHKANETLPASILPEVKVKILGFHGFTTDGDSISPIAYKSKNKYRY